MPKFIMLVGIPAVGKDTWAHNYANTHTNFIIHSSDDIREELYGNAATQGSPSEVFELMRSRTIHALKCGWNVIYNATNLKAKDRKSILSQVKELSGVIIECKIFVAPIEVCKKRNAARERVVPDWVIDRMVSSFQVPVENEGFNNIEVIHTWDGDKLEYMKDIIEKVKNFGDQKNPHHTLPLWEHCHKCCDYAFDKGYIDITIDAAFHDCGKIYTQSIDKNGIAHYYGHGEVGAMLALVCGFPLKVAQTICYHMIMYGTVSEETCNRLGGELMYRIRSLHKCDVEAH